MLRAVSVRALSVLVAVPVLAVLLLLLVWLRLCWGPIEIGWFAHRLAPATVAGERLGFDRAWIARGSGGGLMLGASRIALGRGDAADLAAGQVEVSVQPAGLFAGEARLETVSVRDASVQLVRSADGAVRLANATPGGGGEGGKNGSGAVRLDRLGGVSVRALTVALQDGQTGHRIGAVIAEAELSPWGGTLASGRLRASVSVDGRSVPVVGDGVPVAGGLHWHAKAGAVRPADFAGMLPALAAVDLPVTPEIDLRFASGEVRPRLAQLLVGLGEGTLAVGDGTLPVRNGRVALDLTRTGADGVSAVLRDWRLALAPPGMDAAGSVSPDGTASLPGELGGSGLSAAAIPAARTPAGSAAVADERGASAGATPHGAGTRVTTGSIGRTADPAARSASAVPSGSGPDAVVVGRRIASAGADILPGAPVGLAQSDGTVPAPATATASVGDDAPVFFGSGTASVDDLVHPRRVRVTLVANSDWVRFDGLERYWPEGVANGARRWITENITAGVATGLHVETLLSGDGGWASVREKRRSGGFDARDMEMWWLRPMPPLERMDARAIFQGTDALLVESPSAILPVQAVGAEAERLRGDAVLQPLRVSDGSMRITGLDGKDQIGAVHLVIAGALRDLMCELANPRLSLLSKHPVPFKAPSGTVRSEVSLQLPLENKVAIEDVSVSSRSELKGAHLGDVAGGLALDDADLLVAADTDGLTLDGKGAIGPIESRLHYRMNFAAGGPEQIVEHAQLEGEAGADALGALGVDASDAVGGAGGVSVAYEARRDGLSRIRVALDMTGMTITLPVWSKRAGQKGTLDAEIVLDHGHLRSVGPIHADGPGLSIEGSVSTPADGPRLLRVPRFLLGRTRGAGEVWFPRATGHAGASPEPIRVSARGPVLDLAAIIDAAPDKPAAPRTRPEAGVSRRASKGTAWTADLQFGRVFVGRKTALGRVSAHLENDGRAMVRARVDAADPTALSVRLDGGAGGRVLTGTAADTGRLLRVLGVTDQMAGGAMRLSATLPYPADSSQAAGGVVVGPMTGTVEIGRFVVPDAPFAARLVRDLSIYGWLLAPRTPALTVDRLVAPFSLNGDVLTLTDARAHALALGLTMQGGVDLGRQRLDLHGTVVPAWALNQLPGRLPIVGRLLAPEKGGGVVAITLGITGAFADPKISVDPLSALAPGFLRKLFFR